MKQIKRKLDKSYITLLAGFVLAVKMSQIHAIHDNIYWFVPFNILAIICVAYGIRGINYVSESLSYVDQEASL